jgi:hypothetical protein
MFGVGVIALVVCARCESGHRVSVKRKLAEESVGPGEQCRTLRGGEI